MRNFFLFSGVWLGICLFILFGDSFLMQSKTVEVVNEKKMALDINTAIPDSGFRACLTKMVFEGSTQVWDDLSEKYVTLNYTINGTKYDSLTEESLKQISLAQCDDHGIRNIQGIEYLTNLWELNLSGNKIDDLSFSSTTSPNLHLLYLNNVDYQTLEIDSTLSSQLTVLDVSNNNLNNTIINQYISKSPNLQQLHISGNNLTDELDVSSLKRLQGLWAANNQLTSIKGIADKGETYTNLSGEQETAKLEYLVIGNNKISSIDVSGNPGLLSLQLFDNQISSINLSNNTKLLQLWLHKNNLSSVDLSKNTVVKDLNLSENKISNVVITSDNLKNLYLSNTEFSNLIINDNNPGKMENLDLTNSKINQDAIQNFINRFTSLKKLSVNYNELTSLDVSKLTNLEILNARNNKLKKIDLSSNSSLIDVNLYNNSLESINMPNSCGSLKYLMLSVNSLKSIDLTKCTPLQSLHISSNQLTSLDLSKNTELKDINVAFNNFSSLDFSNNQKIENFCIDDDMLFKINFFQLSNVKTLATGKSYVIPVYGTSFSVNDVLEYVEDYIDYNSYKIYDTTYGDNTDNLVSGKTIQREPGTLLRLRLVLDNPTNSKLTSYDGNYMYNNYYNVYFMQLSSDKYVIDDVNNQIDVGGDSDEEIKKNLNIDWWSNLDISGNKLKVVFDGNTLKEFTLLRITNPKTGDIVIGMIIFLAIFAGVASIFIYREKLVNKV